MDIKEVNEDTIDEIVNRVWEKIKEDVEKKGYTMSSEKTLVFKFMWELAKDINNDNLQFDFEYIAYEKLNGTDKYLDLLFWTYEKYKIAIEFKFPKETENGGSDTATVRRNIYKDISRLKYLVDDKTNEIHIGYFICLTNQSTYFNNKAKLKKYIDLVTHNGYKYEKSKTTLDYEDIRELPDEIEFNWDNINGEGNKVDKECKFAWLNPIKIINKKSNFKRCNL